MHRTPLQDRFPAGRRRLPALDERRPRPTVCARRPGQQPWRHAERQHKSSDEASETKRLIDSGDMEKRMAALDGKKKKLIGQALLNFGIGALQAVEPGRQGKAIAAQVGVNPVELVRVAPVAEAIPMLGKVAVDVSGFMGTVLKLAKSADIAVPL